MSGASGDDHERRFPGESAEYRSARDRLIEAEIELRRSTERVAAARRTLPPGGAVPEDYVFTGANAGGGPEPVALSELFAPDRRTLVVYSFMFGPRDERPCPSCTSILDSLDGAASHVTQHVDLAVIAKSPLPRILAFAEERGWTRLRLISSAENDYNRDYLAEVEDGSQLPMLNVFVREGAEIGHFWGSELLYAHRDEGEDPRHVDFIWPFWNLLDVTPDGRGVDWDPKLSYREEAGAPSTG